MLSSTEIVSLLQANRVFLQERFGVSKMVLYGSYAKGTATKESDVDIMFELPEGDTMPLKRLDNLERFIAELTSIKKVEVVREKNMEPIIYESVKKEGIEIF